MSSDYYAHPMQYPHAAQFRVPYGYQVGQGGYPTVGYPMYGVYHDPSYVHGAMQAPAYSAQQSGSFFNFSNDRFLKGLLIGAAATYLLTNESVQRTAIKGVAKAWSLVQGGVEELKERFHDAEAEIQAAEAAKDE